MVKRSRSMRSKVKKAVKKWKRSRSSAVRGINEQPIIGLTQATIKRQLLKPVQFARLRYQEDLVDLDPGALGATATVVFNANGVYDPYYSFGGHQPLGFDQLIALYYYCAVYKSVITVHFLNTDPNYNQIVGVHCSRGLGSDGRSMIELQSTVFDVISSRGTIPTATDGYGSGSKCESTLTYTYNHKDQFGARMDITDPSFNNTAGANPSEPAFFNVFAYVGQSVNAGVVKAYVTIDYYCLFHTPLEAQPS